MKTKTKKDKNLYYSDKLKILADIFGVKKVDYDGDSVSVGGKKFPVIDDVIILLDDSQYSPDLKKKLDKGENGNIGKAFDYAEDIQFTFGEEWKSFAEILPEHKKEFEDYFDIVDTKTLKGKRVCDLGCGIGRWSFFLKDIVKELIMIDFSDAIFVARKNLEKSNNAVFIMADIKRLPLKKNFADFIFCLGVLHHLPADAINEVRSLEKFAPRLLIYLYYALDNRPFYFKVILSLVTGVRLLVSKVRNPAFRSLFTTFGAVFFYLPFIFLGKILQPFGLSKYVPIYPFYHGKTFGRIRQDVYDRFFTRIEQRVSRKQIMEMKDVFSKITISENIPYWHFICER
jgi:SAM-dependent methyltransferase